jgi:hypothetical protein
MKSIVIFVILSALVGLMWLTSGFWYYNKEDYLPRKVLDHSIPFDVTINTVLLETLKPADVSSGTSSEGL